jgi:hypothetical protein
MESAAVWKEEGQGSDFHLDFKSGKELLVSFSASPQFRNRMI